MQDNQLTDHFMLHEFIRSNIATQHNIDNSPNEHEQANLLRLAILMEEVRILFGNRPIDISSGFRNEAVNKIAQGSPTSAHRLGLACDFNVRGVPTREACIKIRDSFLKFDQLIYEYEDGAYWVHLGLNEGKLRGQVMTYNATKRPKYVNGIV